MRLQPLNRFGRWGVFQQPAKVCKPKLMLDAFRKRALCAVLSILGCGMRRR